MRYPSTLSVFKANLVWSGCLRWNRTFRSGRFGLGTFRSKHFCT